MVRDIKEMQELAHFVSKVSNNINNFACLGWDSDNNIQAIRGTDKDGVIMDAIKSNVTPVMLVEYAKEYRGGYKAGNYYYLLN